MDGGAETHLRLRPAAEYMETVYEFTTGKNDWNTFEIGLEDEHIVVRDETGRVELEESDIDELIRGLDETRRRLREKQREPTAKRPAEGAGEKDGDAGDGE